MGKKPFIAVDEWHTRLRNELKQPKRAQWRVLPVEMFHNPAWQALNRVRVTAVLAMLTNLRSVPKDSTKDRKGVPVHKPVLKDNGEFTLTIAQLQARGLKSRSTAMRARKKAWGRGFFDVIDSGNLHRSGTYRYSEQWKQYPHGDWRPVGQRPPGENAYPDQGCAAKDRMENADVNFDVGLDVNSDV